MCATNKTKFWKIQGKKKLMELGKLLNQNRGICPWRVPGVGKGFPTGEFKTSSKFRSTNTNCGNRNHLSVHWGTHSKHLSLFSSLPGKQKSSLWDRDDRAMCPNLLLAVLLNHGGTLRLDREPSQSTDSQMGLLRQSDSVSTGLRVSIFNKTFQVETFFMAWSLVNP